MSKHFFELFNELAKNQGFTVAILVVGMVWMSYQDHVNREYRNQEIQRLQVELKKCSERIITIYEAHQHPHHAEEEDKRRN